MIGIKKTFSLNKIREVLLRQEKKVEEEIETLDKDDPVNSLEIAESSEPGTDSWMADTHGRVVAVKQNLLELLTKTKKALLNLKTGKYGKCERCGQNIEPQRLEAIPTATLCISCSKKVLKKN